MHQPRASFEEPCARLGLSELVYSHVKAHHHRLSVHSRVGSGLCHKKSYSAFIFQVCDLLLFARVCLCFERQSKREKENVLHCLCQKSRKWKHGKAWWREREDKQWCTTDIGKSPCEPWDVWGNGGVMHKCLSHTVNRVQFKGLRVIYIYIYIF